MRMPESQLEAGPQESTFPALGLLLLLICADAGFILLHLIDLQTGWLREARVSLELDGGPAEIYQYVKEFWVVVCMAVAYVSTRRVAYASWALVFLFLLLDDSATVHEHAGNWLGRQYQFQAPFGLRPNDVGELLFAAAVGLTILAGVGAAAWRGSEQCRRISRDLGCLVVALGLVGVVVDTLHVIAYFAQSLLEQVLLVVEDGGEMLVMSALMAYAFHVATHFGRTRFDLWSLVKAQLNSNVNIGAWSPVPQILARTSVRPAETP